MNEIYQAIKTWILSIRKSFVAFLITAVLGLLGMGFLGALLYYPAAPILRLLYPPFSTWHGDWVWPTMIITGICFSVGFLLAGIWHKWSSERQWPLWPQRFGYLLILWLWNLGIWLLFLSSSYKP